MYAPVPQVRPRIPFLHCLAASTVWYVAAVVAFAARSLKLGDEWETVLGTLLIGVIPWLLSALLVWLIMRNTGVQPWLLIVIALPFFGMLWLATNFVGAMVAILIMVATGAG